MPDTINDRSYLLTEQINPNSQNLDQLSTLEMVQVFNQEDQRTVDAIAEAAPMLAMAIDRTAESLRDGGRLFYIGAGTSGRLGVLDAAECPPTFCTPPKMVQGILAGGPPALLRSSEALEDLPADGAAAMATHQISALDVVVGITAGGTTPYVHGALEEAKLRGATTIFMACVPAEQVDIDVDIDLRLPVGPEVLAGSTRLKSGTVTKMALNILSTGVMVKLGKVYGNRMVDVSVTNTKLHDRALRIISALTDLSRDEADTLLGKSDQKVKLALLMHWADLDKDAAQAALDQNNGNLRQALMARPE
ncbi:N-acetylmuramic acid 6-phosphate etherase [Leptolyngbyaceae cyanobacterium CCMR0082]|uniref:N-acetylmuramic acid 6-phosphate etherase n=2 Tax=Adonisia turfae TaxID=2950184 RepID=A0A6M0S0W5_9CYAN|nr:N-acetylmuramic acid 6-phosphate etherase [Adonisia turfae]MDV3352287.1 N-acetylmuramic acid 6-phosphate etherase [Leptothoe sp. LEGE 181152]NEZ58199.1 N-acetylmuramic acid 6-phosphate etherase [Adonisia turfae CCMR0081]NEZ61582.1 N-acetylmuramic acid 6-phosphate etherase [Adonisia turfae CCMR0082]